MPAKRRRPRSRVFLKAFDQAGGLVEKVSIHYDEYYSGSPKLIDDGEYRAGLGVRRLEGKIYDSSGNRQSSFVNYYDERGSYLRSTIVDQDGTVAETGPP